MTTGSDAQPHFQAHPTGMPSQPTGHTTSHGHGGKPSYAAANCQHASHSNSIPYYNTAIYIYRPAETMNQCGILTYPFTLLNCPVSHPLHEEMCTVL